MKEAVDRYIDLVVGVTLTLAAIAVINYLTS